MPELVHYNVRDRVAVLTIDNPPVNALSEGVWEGLRIEVARAAADADADAIVLVGAGSTFVAGADIKAFQRLTTRDESLALVARMHALLEGLEDASKPLVAAIHGHALGGGLELAQACHYRVATADAMLGQPEVKLGLIPGAGGTQRLPRLCGPDLALQMCTDGRPIDARRGLAAGLIDEIAQGPLLEAALTFALARAAAGDMRRTRQIVIPEELRQRGVESAAALRSRLKLPRGVNAPIAAIESIEAALTLDFEAGSAREREIFCACVLSTESKAMRHLFFAEREASKVPGLSKDTRAIDIKRAAVIGAGTMGSGIAMSYANAGIPVLLKEADQAALDRGLVTIEAHYESSVARGRLTQDAAARALALITPATTYDAFTTADIVVEAVFEDIDLKRAVFEELGRVTRPECVLASNTSTLDVDALGEASGRPGQVVGHHFFSPATVMSLLEVVRARETSPSVVATSLKLAKRLGKTPVVVGNKFGFVANRMLAAYLREANLLLEEGGAVAAIDAALVEFGMPVGPFGMQDIAGLDVGARIRQHAARIGRPLVHGPESNIADQLVEMGRLGQKTHAGWYRYEAGSRERIPDPIVERLSADAAAARGISRRPIEADEIIARVTTALANEGMRVLEEGVALRASDIDVIYVHGFGFPRHRGGPMFYADTVGLATVLARVRGYRARFGDYWQPSPLLERLVAERRTLYDE